MITNTQSKSYLMFFPENIIDGFNVFELFIVAKTENGIQYENYLLEKKSIASEFPGLSTIDKKQIEEFTDNIINAQFKQLFRDLNTNSNKTAVEAAYEKGTMKLMLNKFKAMVANKNTKWPLYHTIKDASTKKLKKTVCSFSNVIPMLDFEVCRLATGALSIQTYVTINELRIAIDAFMVHEFCLYFEQIYYFLNWDDFQILNWLQHTNIEQYGFATELFYERIVQKLELKHTVNKHDFFEIKEIRTTPTQCVFLSEISNTYIMLTPQWKYDGFLVEGPYQDMIEIQKAGALHKIYRNKEKETNFCEQLKGLHPNFEKQKNGYYYLTFADAKKKNWFLKVYHQFLEDNTEITGMQMLKHFRYSTETVITHFEILQKDAHWVTIQFSVHFGKEQVKLSDLQKIILADQKSILLKDDTIGVFTEEWCTQYGTIIKHAKISAKQIVVPYWILISTQQQDTHQKGLEPKSDVWQQKWIDWQNPEIKVYPVPKTITANLRIYQQKGFEWMALLSEIGAGACLADDMGLGKTLQTICFMAWLHEQSPLSKMLIVCPASLIYNWKIELEKFAPHFKVAVLNEQNISINDFVTQDAQILISSYGKVRSEIEALKEIHFHLVVLDESHNIKNPNALSTKAVQQLQTTHKVALSGTPVMNNTFDLYSQLNFLLPDLLGTQEFFRKTYANPIDRDAKTEAISELKSLTAPYILRRTKSQVAKDLPEKTESIMWCEMDAYQREYYETLKDNIKANIFIDIKEKGIGKSKIGILAGIQKLRQVCSSPVLLKDEEQLTCTSSIKLDMIMDELKHNLRNNKVLIFSQFKGMLHLLADQCKQAGVSFYHFDGDTPVAKRQEMVTAFQQETDTTNVFLVSLMAGNAGITLTAADYVFLVDPWWNQAVQQQAIDRTHRIGQTKNVFAYKMICKNTIEEKIIALQQSKQFISEELVQAEDNFVKTLTEEDIKYLFD